MPVQAGLFFLLFWQVVAIVIIASATVTLCLVVYLSLFLFVLLFLFTPLFQWLFFLCILMSGKIFSLIFTRYLIILCWSCQAKSTTSKGCSLVQLLDQSLAFKNLRETRRGSSFVVVAFAFAFVIVVPLACAIAAVALASLHLYFCISTHWQPMHALIASNSLLCSFVRLFAAWPKANSIEFFASDGRIVHCC